jgi:hypothetical protein
MCEDPIVEEMRANGKAFAFEHGNDLEKMCRALQEKCAKKGHQTVNREPKLLIKELNQSKQSTTN